MDVRFVWCGMEVQAEGNAEECAQLIAGLIRSEDDSEEGGSGREEDNVQVGIKEQVDELAY